MWYRFDAPGAGTFTFVADKSAAIAYEGSSLETLRLLESRGQLDVANDQGQPCCGTLTIPVVRGKRYYFVAGVANNPITPQYTVVGAMN